MTDVTRILSQLESGDPSAAEQLLPLVYDELRKLAAVRMAQENPGQTLQATALVHDAYIRLVDVQQAQHWDSRGHFFSAAAEAMRCVLVDQARHKKSLKAGGDRKRVDLTLADAAAIGPHPDILALNEALTQLENRDSRAAQLVKLRFFVGMTVEEAAESLGISVTTARADWTYAKTWLLSAMLDRSD